MQNQIILSELTGPFEIGWYQNNGGNFYVGFYLLPTGNYRVKIEDDGGITVFNVNDLPEAIEAAHNYCTTKDAKLQEACNQASKEAKMWFNQTRVIETAPNPLAGFTVAQLCDELKRRHAASEAGGVS